MAEVESYVDSDGYTWVYRPNHEKAFRKGFGPLHQIVMYDYLERPFPEGAIVHHKDRRRSNNDLENLLLLPSKKDHDELHGAMRRGDTQLVHYLEGVYQRAMELYRLEWDYQDAEDKAKREAKFEFKRKNKQRSN